MLPERKSCGGSPPCQGCRKLSCNSWGWGPIFTGSLKFRIWRVDRANGELKDTCEVCESKEHVQMHHVRHLADLNKQGRREKPLWMQIMMARKRKSIPLCRRCHMDVHCNRPKSQRQ